MARFFYASERIDRSIEELKDLILRRYSAPEIVLGMPVREGLHLLEYAMEKEEEERLHRQWCALFPLMNMRMIGYESFPNYRDRITGRGLDMRPEEEIITEIQALHAGKEE